MKVAKKKKKQDRKLKHITFFFLPSPLHMIYSLYRPNIWKMKQATLK